MPPGTCSGGTAPRVFGPGYGPGVCVGGRVIYPGHSAPPPPRIIFMLITPPTLAREAPPHPGPGGSLIYPHCLGPGSGALLSSNPLCWYPSNTPRRPQSHSLFPPFYITFAFFRIFSPNFDLILDGDQVLMKFLISHALLMKCYALLIAFAVLYYTIRIQINTIRYRYRFVVLFNFPDQ